METPKAEEVKKGIAVLWESLQCPICLDLMTIPVSTKCDHQFCKFCILKVLDTIKVKREANCPVCKIRITKRSLQDSPGFQRLIAGLQDMIRAYEQDTCSNYFTGLSLQRRQQNVTQEEDKELLHNGLSGGTSGTGLEDEENENHKSLQQSNSSTIAAKQGFAELMELEHSRPFKGQDSGLGDASLLENKNTRSNPTIYYEKPETEILEVVEKATSQPKIRSKRRLTQFMNPSSSLILVPDEELPQLLRRSSRNVKKKDDVEEKQKKSLEKVSEWLSKVPQFMEENSELGGKTKDTFDSEFPASLSESSFSFSTELAEKDNNDIKPAVCAKSLEEQVFGAVYKRERRSKTFSAQPAVVVDPPAPSLLEDTQTHKRKNPKTRKKNILTPTDFVKKSFSEGEEERTVPGEDPPQGIEHENNTANGTSAKQTCADLNDSFKDTNTHQKDLEKLLEKDQNKRKDEAGNSAFEIMPHRPDRKSAKTMHNIMQDIDSDLQEHAKVQVKCPEGRRTCRRKNQKAKLHQGKSARVPEPLVFVSVGEGAFSPDETVKGRPKVEEVQEQIESFPSSEDPETPVMRGTRRSRRLKLVIEEVQESDESHRRKACSPKHVKDNVPATHNEVKQFEEAKASTSYAMAFYPNRNPAQGARRNGCICDEEDIGGIESSETTATNLAAAEAVKPSEESIAEANPPPIDTLLENDPLKTSACHDKCVEMQEEEDKNDSELDPEQLVKSFKVAKRRSFLLSSPDVKKISLRSLSSDKENLQGAKTEESCDVGSETAAATNQVFRNVRECSVFHRQTLRKTENSSCSDLFPPSNAPSSEPNVPKLTPQIDSKEIFDKSDQMMVDESIDAGGETQDDALICLSGNTVSSALSPNKVAKSQIENMPSAPEPVESQLLFTGSGVSAEDMPSVPSKHSHIIEKQLDCTISELEKMKQLDVKPRVSLDTTAVNDRDCNENSVGHISTEASLTPDGLVSPAVQRVHQAEANDQGSCELSGHSLIKCNARRRGKSQKLESSSDSEDGSDGEDQLPPLALIFQTSAMEQELLDHQAQDPGGSKKANRCEGACVAADAGEEQSHLPACPDPDSVHSSQASVDLFGTPDEYDMPIDSSQFESEVLVTQEKLAMQEDLVRLEKLMALVKEALLEKEGGSSLSEVPQEKPVAHEGRKSTGHDLPTTSLSCKKGHSQSSDRKAAPDMGKDSSTVPPDLGESSGCRATQPSVPGHDSITEKAEKTARHSGLNVRYCGAGTPSTKQDNRETNATSAPAEQTPQRHTCGAKLVLVSSGLGSSEQAMVQKFAKRVGGHVVPQVTAEVTHIIMCTDGQLVCQRTLKYFLGIAGRKWVVSFQWISECFQQRKLLDESSFEVRGDVVNGSNHQGPMKARTTEDSNLLMRGYKIYFQGLFTDMTTDQMEWMVELCGAAVVKDPLLFSSERKSHQLVIVQPGPESPQSKYSALGRRAIVLRRGWLLDTVATYTLQNYDTYRL
ncbi:breast cancer type 1 susceptibility protein homolog [Lampris incognitus]|uniref:breast cancer type 1 susceptibility protein homolog n=1 Tax=Lampris incognitus TaxID=2546036 RepID=UPI0024B486B9|nr:breast cancer type 1 susceptibility protein homolog [Lampris incognitus]